MGVVRAFLESSTIHGLAYIPTTRRYVRLLWILVVISGFTTAGFIIYASFQGWSENPVKTTIETLPIAKFTLPKVTVCPPKHTYTDLNYDLIMTENMTLDDETSKELTNYAQELLYDYLYDTIITTVKIGSKHNASGNRKEQLHNDLYAIIMRNLSMLEDEDRYYNWYHGYTYLQFPFYDKDGVNLGISTFATKGSVSTQYFGDKFDDDKVEAIHWCRIMIGPPEDHF